MFSRLVGQFHQSIDATVKTTAVNERIRDIVLSRPTETPEGGNADQLLSVACLEALQRALGNLPNKIDWQVYDYCAAITRLYGTYEDFVNELIKAYIVMLPDLYTVAQLPETITVNHRTGIGQILLNLGTRRQYRNVGEEDAIRALSTARGDGAGYRLIPEAFLVDRLNYRMDVLGSLFGSLDIENVPNAIALHPEVRDFLGKERGESDSATSELENFVKSRNLASHGMPEQILSTDELKKMGRFLKVVATALNDIVTAKIERRHLALGHYTRLGQVTEVYHQGVVGIFRLENEKISIGDQLFSFSKENHIRVKVMSLQLDGVSVQSVEPQTSGEIGAEFDRKIRVGAEIRRIAIPESKSEVREVELVTTPGPEEETQAATIAQTREDDPLLESDSDLSAEVPRDTEA
jgi:hypothetical protein